jgi:hypothetical protein
MTADEVLTKLHAEIAEQRRAAATEPDHARREPLLHDADTREDLAQDEAEAIAQEVGGCGQGGRVVDKSTCAVAGELVSGRRIA